MRAYEKGIEKGREAEKLLIARNLRKAGVSAEVIAQSTGLSPETIEKLAQEVKD